MNINEWQRNNDEYLSKALAWLRLRLARHIDKIHIPKPANEADPRPATDGTASRWRFWGKRNEVTVHPEPLLLGPSSEPEKDELKQAAEAMAAAANVTPPPALLMMARNFGLTKFEQDLLLLCAAMELDTHTADACSRAQNDARRTFPTFALALTLFDDPAWDVLSPERPLRYWRLIEISQPGAQPLTISALRADERIVNFIKGLNYLDDRLAALIAPVDISSLPDYLPPSHRQLVEQVALKISSADGRPQLPLVQLAGPDAQTSLLIAAHSAAALGLRLYRLPIDIIPAQAGELENFVRLIERESQLWPLAIFFDGHDSRDPGGNEPLSPATNALHRFIIRHRGLFFLSTRDVRVGLGRPSLCFDIVKPTRQEQEEVWSRVLPDSMVQGEEPTPGLLANHFDLGLTAIHQIASTTLTSLDTQSDPRSNAELLWQACLINNRPLLDSLAQRTEPKATWKDLVLPVHDLNLLREIVAQVRNRGKVYDEWGFAASRTRGLSINALFAGESGTGKTMAAEVLARELNLNLYCIDLASVVSKYIGETEKNLRRVFDAAECGGVMLCFNEADALFGKRSEVRDSHDRYANIEVNYLLQRLESFGGLVILTTNMSSALDQAFMRRIRFILEFRSHGVTERRAIWKRVFPAETATEFLDLDRLSRLALNGGSINNVAINAAFLAADSGGSVTMKQVLTAARNEYLKLKRPINEADFVWCEQRGAVQ